MRYFLVLGASVLFVCSSISKGYTQYLADFSQMMLPSEIKKEGKLLSHPSEKVLRHQAMERFFAVLAEQPSHFQQNGQPDAGENGRYHDDSLDKGQATGGSSGNVASTDVTRAESQHNTQPVITPEWEDVFSGRYENAVQEQDLSMPKAMRAKKLERHLMAFLRAMQSGGVDTFGMEYSDQPAIQALLEDVAIEQTLPRELPEGNGLEENELPQVTDAQVHPVIDDIIGDIDEATQFDPFSGKVVVEQEDNGSAASKLQQDSVLSASGEKDTQRVNTTNKGQEVVLVLPEEEEDVLVPRVKPPLVFSAEDQKALQALETQKDHLPAHQQFSQENRDTITSSEQFLMRNKEQDAASEEVFLHRSGKPSSRSADAIDMSVDDEQTIIVKASKEALLAEAYKALVSGQVTAAVNLYKKIVADYPQDPDALFGLATAYHRNLQFEQAKRGYMKLLQLEPGHVEALNNFLVLLAEESPEEALIALKKLDRIHPGFGPVIAQIGVIYLKKGEYVQAIDAFKRALAVSPPGEGTIYKYNLAIALDKMGAGQQALEYYTQVWHEVENGVVIPVSIEQLRERMVFLQEQNR